MKIIGSLILLALNNILLSQDNQNLNTFSKMNVSILGGVNFSKDTDLGGSIQLEGKTNLCSHLNLKLSVGYSLIREDASYTIKSYSHFIIDNIEGYHLDTYDVNEIQHSVIPINVGVEYTLNDNAFSPYGVFELGYSFYSSEQQFASSTSGIWYETEEEVPPEYRNPAPNVTDDSCFGLGAGIGVKYKISNSLTLNVLYMYRYFDKIINTNQLLFGITF
jgi:opacity protein-like surface antigen